MITIEKKSNLGSTTLKHSIYFDPNDAKSYAASILLHEALKVLDVDYLDNIEYRNKKIQFSRDYLTEIQNRLGSISCTYCGKKNLVIELDGMKVKNNIKATIDHIHPISKGGPVFDLSNICTCCGTCNNKKRDMLPEEFKLLK